MTVCVSLLRVNTDTRRNILPKATRTRLVTAAQSCNTRRPNTIAWPMLPSSSSTTSVHAQGKLNDEQTRAQPSRNKQENRGLLDPKLGVPEDKGNPLKALRPLFYKPNSKRPRGSRSAPGGEAETDLGEGKSRASCRGTLISDVEGMLRILGADVTVGDEGGNQARLRLSGRVKRLVPGAITMLMRAKLDFRR